MNLDSKIKDIFIKNNEIYGTPRIKIVLNNNGIVASWTKIARIIKIFKLYSVIRIKKMNRKPKEVKKITHGPNQVNRNWSLYSKNELWVRDVTYIPFNKKYTYLSVIKDANTGLIVGYEVSFKTI
ncbi:IS3 family transposase [Spiroplasma tabanidicola]|uniref:IS3 family transposase n=1 Tax=Spiroplasma tabanidicola TaxID=324079 RepID=UPI0012DCADE4|nr:IS3 family transposase [Spiroplasma tabanidicola]